MSRTIRPDNLSGQLRTPYPDSRTDNTPPLGGVRPPSVARLLNIKDAAEYLGLSYWTIRDYIIQGLIPSVQMPPARPKEGAARHKSQSLRRVLVDRQDLDMFIEARKQK